MSSSASFASGKAPLRSERSEALMIMRGLRTSCATTVESRPRALSRSRSAPSRWNRAIESVRLLNVPASRRVSSSEPLPDRSIFRARSPVAATSFIVPVMTARGRVTLRATK
jgi:hypothetical protein